MADIVSLFSDKQLIELCEVSQEIACECPAYLIGLLRKVRQFQRYTATCVQSAAEAGAAPQEDEYLQRLENHQWLGEQMVRVEATLTQLIYEFMQRENLLDAEQNLDLEKFAQRSYEASLRQAS